MNKTVALATLSIALLFGSLATAYTLDDVFKFPQWIATSEWCHTDWAKESARANGLIAGPNITILFYEFQVDEDRDRLEYWWSRDAYLDVNGTHLPFVGMWNDGKLHWLTNDDGSRKHWGWSNPKRGETYCCNLVFAGRLPTGASEISLCEVRADGKPTGYGASSIKIWPPLRNWRFSNVTLEQYRQSGRTLPISRVSEAQLRGRLFRSNDPIEGIYENAGNDCWRLGVYKEGSGLYKIVHLKNSERLWWYEGQDKATLHPTATRGLFKADWIDETFHENKTALVTFDGATMRVAGNEWPIDNGQEEITFLKMYPRGDEAQDIESGNLAASVSSGSGFALKNGYLVTNHHVIDGADDIRVWRVGKDGEKDGKGKVVCYDTELDLAVVKTPFADTDPPYSIYRNTVDTGEAVFALGYPLVETMGKELKLTTGVISSTSGFQDDPNLYQMSAAVQPGNSGGPLFSERGCALVGVVAAHHRGAENVSYAVKSSQLARFLDENHLGYLMPSKMSLFKKKLDQRVRELRPYVYRIECVSGGSFGGGGSPNGGGERTIWYPKVEENYITRDVQELVVTRVILKKDSTIVEIGGKRLSVCWLNRSTYLQAGQRKFYMVKVEGLPTEEGRTNEAIDYVFRTFKAHFSPLPKDVKQVDFIEPEESSAAFVIKGIHLDE